MAGSVIGAQDTPSIMTYLYSTLWIKEVHTSFSPEIQWSISQKPPGKNLPSLCGNILLLQEKKIFSPYLFMANLSVRKKMPDDLAHPSVSNPRHTFLTTYKDIFVNRIQYQIPASTAFVYTDHFV